MRRARDRTAKNAGGYRATCGWDLICFCYLTLFAHAFNAQLDDVTGFDVDRRIEAQPYPCGCTGRDYVARQQGHKLAYVAYQKCYVEDHVGGGTVLVCLAVNLEPQLYVVDVFHF